MVRKGVQVLIEELATFLLGPTDVAGIIMALAENGCGGAGGRRCELIETSEGQVEEIQKMFLKAVLLLEEKLTAVESATI